jgi:geranylgeranyl diphosphate synthase type II
MIDRRLALLVNREDPASLSDGVRYVFSAPGKRIRSTLVLLSCESVGGNVGEALDAAVAVEMMHNFTLVHDDIMDSAARRHGRPTVHTRWDVNKALLVGDVLLGLGFRCLLRTRSDSTRRIAGVYTAGLLEVCDGQALDLRFEHQKDVTLDDYFRMIQKKTGGLIAMSAELGGIVGGGSEKELAALRKFGFFLGRAFQLQDDLLDVVAEQKKFGKRIGGDIVIGKKTFLLLSAVERARGKDRALVEDLLRQGGVSPAERLDMRACRAMVKDVRRIYERYGVLDDARAHIRNNTSKAVAALYVLPANRGTGTLRWLAEELEGRVS